MVTMPTGSIVVRRSLGRRLRALRATAGKTTADVVAAGVCSKAKLNRMESGAGTLRMSDVRTLCWLYRADEATTEALAEMALNTAVDGWWEDFGDVVPQWFGTYVELEAAASSVDIYDGEAIYGVLQTVDYRRALIAALAGPPAPDEVERRLRLHTERQRAALDREPPLRTRVVLGEGALLREVGGSDVMAAQVEHLRGVAAQPHVEVRVLTWSAGAHRAMNGPLAILGFDSPDDPDVIYLETYTGARYVEAPATLQNGRDMFAMVRDLSTPIEEYLR
jgi:transcriptional regulator with XRE-family HTH domain